MRALDLFSGAAGGWALGLHRAGIETVAACEADPWRRAVYGRNFPGVRLYDDVRTLTGERVLADVGAVDLVAGSPPCQDASTANSKGRGIDGERTGLFLDFIRIVGELRPRWVCAENVPGIRTRGADRIITALEEAGYAVWPVVVGAVHAGAPHRRMRVIFVAADAVGAAGRLDAPRTRPVNGRWQARPGFDGGAPADAAHIGSDARAELPAPIRAIGEAWPDWNGGLAGLGRVDARFPEILADFCRANCRIEACLRKRSTPGQSSVSSVRPSSVAVGSTDALRIGPDSFQDDTVPRAARTAVWSQNLPGTAPEQRRCAGASVSPAERWTISTRITSTESCQTTEPKTSKHSAGLVTCVITGRRVSAACALLGEHSPAAKRLARAALASYGDAFMPQIAEAFGRAIVELDGLRAAA